MGFLGVNRDIGGPTSMIPSSVEGGHKDKNPNHKTLVEAQTNLQKIIQEHLF